MKLVKHNDELATRMQLLDIPADSQLAKEFIELYEKRCTECQEDRLGCTVRPACKNRNFLNMLIEIGVEPEDLPSFCYSQYLDQVKRFILERKGRGMIDRRLQTKDFLSTLRVSSIKHFLSRFKKVWQKTSDVQEDNIILVAGDDLIFHFDFERGIVIVNPLHHRIDNYQIFRMYVELLSEYYDISGKASDLTDNWWLLTIEIEDAKMPKEGPVLNLKEFEHFEDMQLDVDGNSVVIEAEVISNGGGAPFEVRDLHALFEESSKLKRRKKAK
ncbi:MAG: hypothetical protein ACFFD6_05795 [Candidatus Thorarchaeota archaeon]